MHGLGLAMFLVLVELRRFQDPPPQMAEPIVDSNGKRQPIVATYPPLGLVTKLTTAVVKFTFTLKDETGSVDVNWEVKLHHASIGSHKWEEFELKRSPAFLFQPQSQKHAKGVLLAFEANVNITAAIRFRFSFRRGREESWFVVGEDRQPESIVIPKMRLEDHPSKSLEINDYMQELNQELQSKLLDDGSKSGIISWIVEAPVKAASGESPYMTQVMFGKPFGGKFLRWSAISRNTTSWMAPRQGQEYFKLDVAAITCSFINYQGEHLVVLGLSGFENIMTIFGDNNEGALMIKLADVDKIRNEREAPGYGRVIVAVGADLETTLNSTLDQARAIFSSAERLLDKDFGKQPDDNWADQWINGLIFSPTNDLHEMRTEEDIIESLDALSAKGITVSSIILDDTWQKVDQNQPSRFHAGLVDFEADPGAFKSGLQRAVAEIKNRHRTIRSVVIEHAIFGYWGGISNRDGSERSIQKNYSTTCVRRSEAIQPNQKTELTLSVVSSQDAQKFFNHYYEFLLHCDIAAVRSDGLYMLETLTSARDRCSLAEAYLDAQTLAAQRTFPSATLTNMSLSPSALLNNLKSSHKQVVGNIGVFPDHRKHVFNNANNALLSNGIGNIPDWGSIESTKDHGTFHAATRAISGGPIQISSFDDSDTVNLEIFQKITAVTAKGKTVALRPSGIGRTTNPYIGFEDNVLIKITNTHNVEAVAVSILGIFNVSDKLMSDILQLQDFLDIDPMREYIVRSIFGTISDHLRLNSSLFISISIEVSDYDFLCAYPLTALTCTKGDNIVHVTVLGLQRKMIGATAIISSAYSFEDNVLCLKTVVKGFGYLDHMKLNESLLEFYISDLARRSINENTCKLQVQGKCFAPSTGTVSVKDRVMTLDLESIWEEQNLESNTDEIFVEVTLYPF